MKPHRKRPLTSLCAGLLAGSLAAALCTSSPAAGADAVDGPAAPRAAIGAVRHLQMGVGKSVIVDLPADASEIFVGNPAVANAIVRSARRLYIDAIANGQTSIFALDKDGHQIVVFELSIGRDIGELQELLRTALPGNDIQVKTVADSVILMGSVGSAGEAQKALDIASGFVGISVLGGATGPGGAQPFMTEDELLQTLTLIFSAAIESMVDLLLNGTAALLAHPAQAAALRADQGLAATRRRR